MSDPINGGMCGPSGLPAGAASDADELPTVPPGNPDVQVTGPSDGLLGKLGYYDVVIDGRTQSMSRHDIEKLECPAPQSANKPAAPAPPAPKTEFHPGVMHDHQPSGRWSEIQDDPRNKGFVGFACRHSNPHDTLSTASFAELTGKKIATEHLQWYASGRGAEFKEDDNLKLMLRTDAGVQKVLADMIPKDRTSGSYTGHVKLEQRDYKDADFKNSYGTIDRLDFTVDYDKQTIHVWFQDRYEWHPVYPGYKQFPDDFVRPTNCVHAAAVELKSQGARDYWMKGETTLPLAEIRSPAARKDDFMESDPGVWMVDKGMHNL